MIATVCEIPNGRITIEENVLRVSLKYLTMAFGNMAASSNISETTEKSIPSWKIAGEIGLMYVNAMYRVHVLLLRLQLMVTVMQYSYTKLKMEFMVKHSSTA